MRVADFTFELPDSLIARHPLAERRGSRLLTLDGPSGALAHRQFTDLLEHLRPGDLMVFNNTRVIPARLFGQKASGGKLEILVERVLDTHRVLAHVRSSKSPKPGSKILIDGGGEAEMLADDVLQIVEDAGRSGHRVKVIDRPRPVEGAA